MQKMILTPLLVLGIVLLFKPLGAFGANVYTIQSSILPEPLYTIQAEKTFTNHQVEIKRDNSTFIQPSFYFYSQSAPDSKVNCANTEPIHWKTGYFRPHAKNSTCQSTISSIQNIYFPGKYYSWQPHGYNPYLGLSLGAQEKKDTYSYKENTTVKTERQWIPRKNPATGLQTFWIIDP